MSHSQEHPDSPLAFYKRLAALELTIAELKIALTAFNTIVSPEGWISEVFEIMEASYQQQFTELNQRCQGIETELQSMNGELDILLQHLTGTTG